MPTLLRIDSSARNAGSHSRSLADHAVSRWRLANPQGTVVVRDLAARPLPHLTDATLRAFANPPRSATDAPPGLALSEELIRELEAASDLLLSCPIYNFNVPSPLKAYVDHVVRSERTFRYSAAGYEGLLRGRPAVVLTVRGGPAAPTPADDPASNFVISALRFIGFEAVVHVDASGLAGAPEARTQSLSAARERLDRWFGGCADADGGEPEWVGPFSAEDRRQIAALRTGQARAIESGDAEGYAALCAADVHLMVPGHDVIVGRDRLLALERRLFQATRFPPLRKTPLRVERGGELAVEIGRQELELPPGAVGAGLAARAQKYTHVYRRTDSGWRFAVLMSNPSA